MTDICYPARAPLLSVLQAQQAIAAVINTIQDTELLPLDQVLGRVLATALASPIAIPPQANAAMDGYGFAAADRVKDEIFSLQQVGISWAGKPFAKKLQAGQCVRIFTGAVVPEGVDSVIAQEQIRRDGDSIVFPADTAPYKNIRAAGSDVQQDQLLLTAGKVLTAVDIGLLASAGISQVAVKRRLKIGFFSSGDELVSLGQPLLPGQIYDSNRHQLRALLQNPQYQPSDLGIIKDDPALLEQTLLSAAAAHDVLISTGGASVGDADFIRQCLANCGVVEFWKIAVKPGKPLAFGRIGDCLFFGLPGNPVAVLVSFEKFVRPALAQLAGARPCHTLAFKVRCDSRLRKGAGRQEYQRGLLRQDRNGELSVILAGGQDSHQLNSASNANCFIVLEPDNQGVEAGEMVTVEPFQTVL